MPREIELLSAQEYENLDEHQQAEYIGSLFDVITQEDEISEGEGEGEEPSILEVQMSDTEEIDVVENENLFEEVPSCEQNDVDDGPLATPDEQPSTSSQNCEKFITRDGTEWMKAPQPTHQARRCNVFRERPGPHRSTYLMTPRQLFKLLLDEILIHGIVRYTNKKAQITYDNYNAQNPTQRPLVWKNTNEAELYTFFGILIMIGAERSHEELLRSLWLPGRCPLYRAAMGLNRFYDILRFIRFDDARTRIERAQTDKAAPIRELWDGVMANLKKIYRPSAELTIDEQLFPYRGRTKFTQYIPSKPAKYGIKVWWICDSKSSFPLSGQIYTGKQPSGREVRQGERVVKDLVAPYIGSGRNITMDNFFTSFPLVQDLLAKNLTVVGTLRKNKTCIPKEMIDNRRLPIGTSCFGFRKEMTIVAYKQRESNSVVLLSSMHNDAAIAPSGKPDIIEFYNQTKGGVDNMDALLRQYTTQRHTNRWPLSLFFNIIDICALAAYIVYAENNPNLDKKRCARNQFLRSLARDLCDDQIRERATNTQITRHYTTKSAIQDILGIPLELITDAPSTSAAPRDTTGRKEVTGVCYICINNKPKIRRKTRKLCEICSKPVCLQHSRDRSFCLSCH